MVGAVHAGGHPHQPSTGGEQIQKPEQVKHRTVAHGSVTVFSHSPDSPTGLLWFWTEAGGGGQREGERGAGQPSTPRGDVLCLLPAPRRPSSGAGAAAGLLVARQERHAGEGLGTVPALVLLGVGVRLQVGPEIGAVGEGPAAVRARVGLLAWERKRSAVSVSLLGHRSWPQGHGSLFINKPQGAWVAQLVSVGLWVSAPVMGSGS